MAGAKDASAPRNAGTEEERDDETTGMSARPGFGDDPREWLPVARSQAGREVSAETRNIREAARGMPGRESVTRGGVGWLDLGRTSATVASAGVCRTAGSQRLQLIQHPVARSERSGRRSIAGGCRSAAPVAGQFCAGMKITFFPGGTPGGGFETVVYNGAKAAQTALGPDVTYQWSDWDPNKMVTQFQQSVATKPDGIAVMGHPGDNAFDPLIHDAEKQGILVTVMNTELPKAEAQFASSGMGYVGAVLHDAARRSPTRRSSATTSSRVMR